MCVCIWKSTIFLPRAHFAGDSLCSKKDPTVNTYSTTKHLTSLTLSITPSTVSTSDTYKVSGVLKDTSISGTPPISSKKIVITANAPIAIGSKTTDSAGKYIADGLKAPTKTGHMTYYHIFMVTAYAAQKILLHGH